MMRIKRFFILLLLTGVFITFALFFDKAEAKTYDPLLDPRCEVINTDTVETWSGSYMWYPGMLAAYMQEQHKQKSRNRCVKVNYPGKFFQRSNKAFFRKSVRLQDEVELKWSGPESIRAVINDECLNKQTTAILLKPGIHQLFFEIETCNRLPALIVSGKGIEDLLGWEVSLDSYSWCNPETDTRHNKPRISPDMEQEITVRIPPDNYVILKNVLEKDGVIKMEEKSKLIVDFKHLEVGAVKLRVKGNGSLFFTVGESINEALNNNLNDFEQYTIPNIALTGEEQNIILPERALRFVRIESENYCVIDSLYFEAKVWPVDFKMQFESDNEKLNNLWNAGVATLHTSMHNFYLDGVKRDYLPWSMDAVVSMLAGDYLFGDRQVSRNGLSISLMPLNPKVSDWGIVDYPLHALIGFKHDYLCYGDLSTSLMYKDRIIQQLNLYESVLDQNGLLTAIPSSSEKVIKGVDNEKRVTVMSDTTSGFIPGWSRKEGPDTYGTPAYVQILLYANLKIGAYFAYLWNENNLARKYSESAERLRKEIMNRFWDSERKAFINGYLKNGEKDTRISHHAQYWAVLADLYPKEYYDTLFDEVLPNISHYKETISYEKGYEFFAYVKAGRVKDVLELLDLVWGDWLREGNTRFPENFSYNASLSDQLKFYSRPFGLSLCHGANGVPPIVAVLNGILGFSQSDKMISEYTITPQLLDLNWAKGQIPVKEGTIDLELNKNGASTIEIPGNCTVRVKSNGSKLLKFDKPGKYEFTL